MGFSYPPLHAAHSCSAQPQCERQLRAWLSCALTQACRTMVFQSATKGKPTRMKNTATRRRKRCGWVGEATSPDPAKALYTPLQIGAVHAFANSSNTGVCNLLCFVATLDLRGSCRNTLSNARTRFCARRETPAPSTQESERSCLRATCVSCPRCCQRFACPVAPTCVVVNTRAAGKLQQ